MKIHFTEYHLQAIEIYRKLKAFGLTDLDIKYVLQILDTSLELFSSELKENRK